CSNDGHLVATLCQGSGKATAVRTNACRFRSVQIAEKKDSHEARASEQLSAVRAERQESTQAAWEVVDDFPASAAVQIRSNTCVSGMRWEPRLGASVSMWYPVA